MSVLVLGANSGIAKCVAQRYAKAGRNIYLAGRNEEQLAKLAQDLNVRYKVNCPFSLFEATDYQSHAGFLQKVLEQMPDLDTVLLAFGYLGSQELAVKDFAETLKILEVNFIGAVSILTHLSNHLAKKGSGTIAIISSVAGDRGRQSNYVYGAAKGGLSTFAQGLRQRMAKFGVQVVTIKPGFVDTPMTYGLELPKRMVASPEKVADDIYQAILKGKDIVYTPWFWRPIMTIVKLVPERIFKKSGGK